MTTTGVQTPHNQMIDGLRAALGQDPRALEVLAHALEGLYSGIPSCCVEFFCRRHLLGDGTSDGSLGTARHVAEERGCGPTREDWEEWCTRVDPRNYVACDRCWAQREAVSVQMNGSFVPTLIQVLEAARGAGATTASPAPILNPNPEVVHGDGRR